MSRGHRALRERAKVRKARKVVVPIYSNVKAAFSALSLSKGSRDEMSSQYPVGRASVPAKRRHPGIRRRCAFGGGSRRRQSRYSIPSFHCCLLLAATCQLSPDSLALKLSCGLPPCGRVPSFAIRNSKFEISSLCPMPHAHFQVAI